jgi:hypothetical protein
MWKLVRGADPLPRLAAAALQLPELGSRELGDAITNHRTSWVRLVSTETGTVYIKTYSYSTWAGRLRAITRTRPGCRSRAATEYDALAWLVANGFPTAAPLAVLERRTLGFVRQAVLITGAAEGTAADSFLASSPCSEREEVGAAILAFVARLHRAGFRDGNLDLRNLLVQRSAEGGWRIAKIDSPRFRLRRPGTQVDRLVRRDRQRLLPQLAALNALPICP